MKKITTLMSVAIIAILSLSLTSCDEQIANDLEGTWEGNMYISSIYDGVTYDATYSEICFSQNPYASASGTGYWIDYYQNAGWGYGYDYVANHIEWTVKNGIINIYFVEDNYYMQIADYDLNGNYFTGTIIDGNNTVDFSLVKTSSPNWDDFYYDDGYYDYGYAKPSIGTENSNAKLQKPKRFLRKK